MSEGRGTALSELDPNNIEPWTADQLCILEVINQMGSIRRFSRDYMIKDENVLEHVGFVGTYCAIIGTRLNQGGHCIDMGRLLTRAVLHDVEENLTGDVPRPTKYSTKAVHRGLSSYGKQAANHVFSSIGLTDIGPWINAKDDSVEGAILKLADFASVVIKVVTEIVYYGNRSFVRVLNEMWQSSGEFVTDICHRYMELTPFAIGLSQILAKVVGDVENNTNSFEINSWIDKFEG